LRAAPATVFMPFDGSPQALWTFPVARTICRLMEGSLHLVLPAETRAAREGLTLLEDPAADATWHEMTGDLAIGISQLASFNPEAFIVIPAHGATRPESGLDRGPEEILRRAPCPVLLVRPEMEFKEWTLRRILIFQDGTAAAARALCPVARLAEKSGAEVLILHVTSERTPEALEPGAMVVPAYVDQPQHEWPSWMDAFLGRIRHLCRMSPDVALRFHWTRGEPGREIVRLALRGAADLVTLLRSRSPDAVRGQIFRQVLRDAPCPILVLPALSR
jgi:nucleotide-binding universal stress UspA family protein